MRMIPYESQYAKPIADLLNEFLPFEPEDATTVEQAGGIRLLCMENEQVIGYIAGYLIENATDEFPYFQDILQPLHRAISIRSTLYTSHFVVHPAYRKKGVGSALVDAYMQQAKQYANAVVVVGWVQSDTNRWAAEKQFSRHEFSQIAYIPRYFEPYEVYCPNCAGLCYCDANILYKEF